MNHIAINVPVDRMDAYYDKLRTKGVESSRVINHDDSPMQSSLETTPTTFVRSIYFYDPDGIALEFAAMDSRHPAGRRCEARASPRRRRSALPRDG